MKNVLIVEDDYDLLKCEEDALENENTTAYLSLTVEDAIEHISTNTFDLIVSDFNLGSKCALDLLSFLQRNNQLRLPPVIIFSAAGKDFLKDVTSLLKYPNLKIICKPEFGELKRAVSSVLG